MKQTIFTVMLLLAGCAARAQVGINTQNPQGTFHVDGAKDNPDTGTPSMEQQANDFLVNTEGNVGIGNILPASKLEVNGAQTNTTAYNAGSNRTIDFAKSNLAYTAASPGGTFILTNVKDGGTYSLTARGTANGTATFTASGFTTKYVNNVASIAGKETLYTLLAIGNIIYVFTAIGF